MRDHHHPKHYRCLLSLTKRLERAVQMFAVVFVRDRQADISQFVRFHGLIQADTRRKLHEGLVGSIMRYDYRGQPLELKALKHCFRSNEDAR